MDLIDIILNHEDTRIVPSATIKHAHKPQQITFSSEINTKSYKEQINNLLKRFIEKENNNDNKEDNEPRSQMRDIEINIMTENYAKLVDVDPQFKLEDCSFITPRKTHRITSKHSGWKKDPSSGRSFYFPLETKGISLVSKGADLFEGDKFRRHSKEHLASPMIGSETLKNLSKEYDAASIVQEYSLMIQGRLTFAPRPLQLNQLTHLLNESGELVSFEDYLHDAKKNEGVRFGIMDEFMRLGIDPMSVVKGYKHDPWTAAINKFLEATGPHGTYMYSISGINTRLIDASKFKNKKEFKKRIFSQYDTDNSVEVCSDFMKRLGEYRGITQGVGMTYSHDSDCLLVDTTLGGVSVDIGDLVLNSSQESYLTPFFKMKQTCNFFYKIFFPEVKDNDPKFLKMFEESFVSEYIKYSDMTNSLIEDVEFRNLVRENINCTLSQMDQIIKRNGRDLRTDFIDWK